MGEKHPEKKAGRDKDNHCDREKAHLNKVPKSETDKPVRDVDVRRVVGDFKYATD